MTESNRFIDMGYFINEYVLYAKELTDAPIDFHLVMAKSILSNVIGKRIYINFRYGKQYLNQYNIIVAPPSSRKTATYNIGRRLLSRLGKNNIVLPDQCTPEALAEILSLKSHGLYISDEFSVFLNDAINKKYGSGTINMVTKLYDCPDEYTLARRGENSIYIKDPFLNFMVFIQPLKYAEYFLNENNIGLGFPHRFEVLVSNDYTCRARQSITTKDYENENKLVEILQNIDKAIGNQSIEAKFSNELHDLIFEKIESKYNDKWKDDSILTKFPPRLVDQIYRNSVLVALQRLYLVNLDISKFSINEYINIQKEDVLSAINFCEKKNVPSILELRLLTTKNTKYDNYLKILEGVRRLITNSRIPVTRSKVLQNLNIVTKDWSEFSKQMVEEKIIEIHPRTAYHAEYYTLR